MTGTYTKKATQFTAKTRYYSYWKDYRLRGKIRRTDRIFFKLITGIKHEMATTKRRRYKIC